VTLFGVDVGKSANAGAYFTQPTGMTERYDLSDTPFGPSNASDDVTQATAGNSGSNSSTISGNKARNWVAQQIALRAPSHHISIETGAYGVQTFDQSTTGLTSVTVSKTNSATTTLLLVSFRDDCSAAAVSVTYNSVPMTQVVQSSDSQDQIWKLDNPSTGTNNVSISTAPCASRTFGTVVSFTGTNTASSTGASAANHGDDRFGPAPFVNITTINGDSMIYDHLWHDLGQTVTPNSPQIKLSEIQEAGGSNETGAASVLSAASAGTYSLGWTHSSSNFSWNEIAVEVNAAQ
jgi:hypothetical protein